MLVLTEMNHRVGHVYGLDSPCHPLWTGTNSSIPIKISRACDVGPAVSKRESHAPCPSMLTVTKVVGLHLYPEHLGMYLYQREDGRCKPEPSGCSFSCDEVTHLGR